MQANPYPRYKPSGVEWLADVPEHWEVDRLKRSSFRVTDGAHISPDLSSPDFPFVSTVDLSEGKIDFDGCLRTSDECYRYLVRTGCRPHKDDLLFSKDGTVGRTAVVDVDRKFVVASSLVIISPKPKRLKSTFLYYWLNNTFLQQDVLLQMSGAALRRISIEKVSRLPVLLPPPAEQQAIAAFLDRETGRVDRLVAKKRELIERLKEKRTALISRTVTRGLPPAAARAAGLPEKPPLKPSTIDWLGEIALHWTTSPIKFLVSIPVTDGPHETPEIFNEGIPFVSAEAISGGKINFDRIRGNITAEDHKRFSKKYKPQRGDIYLIKSGATTGRVAMVETDIEFNIWSPLAAIRCHQWRMNRYFLFFFMQSMEFQTAVELSWSYGTQQNIGMGVIQNLGVPVPPLLEQVAIATYLDVETAKLDMLAGKMEAAIERLQEYRTALITAAVTGKIDVRKTTV